MGKLSDISVIIVNYNSYAFLKDCVKSIRKSVKNLAVEIFVIDNGSKDASNLKKLGLKNVYCIYNKDNEGFAKANNKAAKFIQTKYVLFLNPDTIINEDTLEKTFEFMEKNPQVAVATCRVELPNGKLDDACHRGFPTPWNAFCYFIGIGKLFPASLFFNGYHLGYKDLERIHDIDSCVGAFMFVRTQVGKTISWFDEDYFWYGEDLDFCYRIKKIGWRIVYVPNAKIIHFKGISSGIKKHSQHQSIASNEDRIRSTKARFDVMKIFYRKHYMKKYPFWLTKGVILGIHIIEFITLLRFKISNVKTHTKKFERKFLSAKPKLKTVNL